MYTVCIFATLEVFIAQLKKYKALESNVEFLSEFSIMGNKTMDFANNSFSALMQCQT